MKRFADRVDAGRQLSVRVSELSDLEECVVAGLPRGGVPVAFEIARALMAPLDVLMVRKIGVPSQPELALGAIGEGDVVVVDERVMNATHIDRDAFDVLAARERGELDRRIRRYRGDDRSTPLRGKPVVIVDDGIATGSTVRAALRVATQSGASRLVVAVPVASSDALRLLRDDVDDFVALMVVEGSFTVGEWYQRFDQTSDEEVVDCLARARDDYESSSQGRVPREPESPT